MLVYGENYRNDVIYVNLTKSVVWLIKRRAKFKQKNKVV